MKLLYSDIEIHEDKNPLDGRDFVVCGVDFVQYPESDSKFKMLRGQLSLNREEAAQLIAMLVDAIAEPTTLAGEARIINDLETISERKGRKERNART